MSPRSSSLDQNFTISAVIMQIVTRQHDETVFPVDVTVALETNAPQ
jgi:hypothetical protein